MDKSVVVSNEPVVFNGGVESIPYGVKKRLFFCGSYVLGDDFRNELVIALEHDVPKAHGVSDMQFIINTIDHYGMWMHS